MRRVLWASAPIAVAGVYFFGWRVAALLALANAAGFLAEWAFARPRREPVTSAVFVSATLFTLSLPPTLPAWMAVLGIVFAVVFGKMVFGGFGRNVFNPALTGRAFIYVSFGAQMTGVWSEPVSGAAGGFARYASDAVTSATPGMLLKTGADFSVAGLFLGRTAGVIGGTSVLLTVLCGLYILWNGTADYRIVVSGVAGFLAMQTALWLAGADKAADPLRATLAGSFVIGIFFYATDPVSAAQTSPGRWLYGAFIGMVSSLIGVFSAWPAGTMFAILLANVFAPITDHAIRAMKTGARR
ncbi:MAG: RnfABCDGE type electron transport complex subunit D [Lentisphaerae bacterium]|nr:RnfABCDGE type electron transport complex subunit D [Lentisphaerota bacterium]